MNIKLLSAFLVGATAQSAAPLLGDVGKTTVPGTVSIGVATPYNLPVGENIYGPFEAGFSSQQDFILESLGCSIGSLGHVSGGIDTATAEAMVAVQCDVTLPRTEDGIRVSLLDDCGGHTMQYHFHERLRCLYEDKGGHSPQLGEANDGKAIHGKWENANGNELPLLDACGGHWGPTDNDERIQYHYHVQDKAPFIIGCFGPNDDGSLVSVEQCRALYPGCSGQATRLSTGQDYELWCPCFDADGSNHATKALPVFASEQTTAITTSTPAPESETESETAATGPQIEIEIAEEETTSTGDDKELSKKEKKKEKKEAKKENKRQKKAEKKAKKKADKAATNAEKKQAKNSKKAAKKAKKEAKKSEKEGKAAKKAARRARKAGSNNR